LLHIGETATIQPPHAHFNDEPPELQFRADPLAGDRVNLSRESIVVAAKDQVSSDLGGEVVILNVKSGIYYGLDPAGARVWNLIQKPQSVAEVREALLREYDVEPSRFETDLMALLEKLLAEGLVEVQSSPQERCMD
jgi:hypothetical protein